ncbi:PAP2 superfamily protein [mine drainage metagenome]|uniref:PAP2 superfamily protein n=1 Tax=mine drainage metagenome TaxID=410659 RepID=A0A1J5RTP7_9ZZZZ
MGRQIVMKEILYDWGGANVWLFHAINGWRGATLDRVMPLGTRLGDHNLFPIYLTLIVLAAAFATVRASRIETPGQQATLWLGALVVLCLAYLADGAFLGWAKSWFDFPRPLLALPQGTVRVLGAAEYRHSLPSGHASFAMTLAAGLWPLLGRWQRWAATAFVLWVGLSRVYVGAHFPADVLAGWLSAFSLVWLLRIIARRCLTELYPSHV